MQAAYANTDLRIVALDIEPQRHERDVRTEIARRELIFGVLQDIGRHSQDAFGVWGVPMSFLIHRGGRVRRRIYGLRGDGESSDRAWPDARAQIDSLRREQPAQASGT